MSKGGRSYVKLSGCLYFGIHPDRVKPDIPFIHHYVSLVEEHEFPGWLEEQKQQPTASTYHSFPVKDRKAPSLEALTEIVDFLLGLKGILYIFCKGGHGRSGTLASALYGRINSLSGNDAMRYINRQWHKQRDLTLLRPKIVKLGSPQTACQKRIVKEYLGGKKSVK